MTDLIVRDNGSVEEKERMVRAFGFRSCGKRKWCNAYGLRKRCQFFTPGDPFKDKTCHCPENVEIPDEEAKAFIAAFAGVAIGTLVSAIDYTIEKAFEDKKGEKKE